MGFEFVDEWRSDGNESSQRLVIVGASARAAAFSALRAGFRPWCVDLFADLDLAGICPARRIPLADYPGELAAMTAQAPAGPWMYTGALENQPAVVQMLEEARPLWGNGANVLRRVRLPWTVAHFLASAGLPCPRVRRTAKGDLGAGQWLAKPLSGGGGQGISFWSGNAVEDQEAYYQEYIEGKACAAVYVGGHHQARLLGVTRQLVGATWLHAEPFHYCGSVGPLQLTRSTETAFQRLGNALTDGFGLCGLFGVDCILQDGVPYPVEVNPRYTASVEVLELATGMEALGLHRQVFSPDLNWQVDGSLAMNSRNTSANHEIVGKAIFFARSPLIVPSQGPWQAALESPCTGFRPFADIPRAGERIEEGRPIVTFFARASSMDDCVEQLRDRAQSLDCRLLGH
jgi:uncharacterized protein